MPLAGNNSFNTVPTQDGIVNIPMVSSTGPALLMLTGNAFYVQSSNSSAANNPGNGNSPAAPFSTLQFALGKCGANQGDVIFVLPGHVETVSGAAGLNFAAGICDGVTVIFLGSGSDRSVVNFTTSTAAQAVIAAANVTLVNPRFTCNFDAVAIAISITGSDCTIINGEFYDNPATAATIQISATSTANRLTINGYTYYASTTGTQKTEAIRFVGNDRMRLENLHITGSFSTGVLNNITTLATNMLLKNSYVNNTHASGLAITILTTTTGAVMSSAVSNTAATRVITSAHILTGDIATGITIAGTGPSAFVRT